MIKPMEPGGGVPLEGVVLAQAFEFEALLNVLERRGGLKRGLGLDSQPKGRSGASWLGRAVISAETPA